MSSIFVKAVVTLFIRNLPMTMNHFAAPLWRDLRSAPTSCRELTLADQNLWVDLVISILFKKETPLAK